MEPREPIKITVKDGLDENRFYYAEFNCEKYADQKIHDLWIDLINNNRNEMNIGSKLHLTIHYIYSKSKLTKATIEKWD